jgi:hypothetical protein
LVDHEEYIRLLNSLHRIPIDSPVLMNAASLIFAYKKNGNIGNSTNLSAEELIDYKDRLTGDLLIGGATISHQNHLLLTANKKDFPEPFWEIEEQFEIKKDSGAIIKVFLLKPDTSQLLQSLDNEVKLIEPSTQPSKKGFYEYRG